MLGRLLRHILESGTTRVWDVMGLYGAIGPDTNKGKRFGKFGSGSIICFPQTTIFNERYIHIGNETMIGSNVALSAGMVPGQVCLTDPVVRIGDRCLIGRGSGIVGHLSIDIGNDVWTGHHVYITDQSHGYEDVSLPISLQSQPESPVVIGDGSDQVSLRKLQKHLKKLPKKLSKDQVREVRNRLKAVGGLNMPIPKGPMPMNRNAKIPKR